MSDPLAQLAELDGVPQAVESARAACDTLRWHQALRNKGEQARAESSVRAVRCSAALDGARLPLELVRDAARGAGTLPDDGAGRVVRGALRAMSTTDTLLRGSWRQAPLQALASLHVAAAAGLVPDDELGRPRREGERPGDLPGLGPACAGRELAARLDSVAHLIAGGSAAPALVVAAVVHAEVLTLRPFAAGNGVVARAMARLVVVGSGLDPTGVAVPEAAHLAEANGYAACAGGYLKGGPPGVLAWIEHCSRALVDGAAEGGAVCDAVHAGRLPTD